MARNRAGRNRLKRFEIEDRRRNVARLWLRRITQREIARALNVSLVTVVRDLRSLRNDWRQQCAQDIADRQAEILAEINEIKRRAWQSDDLQKVLAAIDREIEILGLKAPPRLIIQGGDEDKPVRIEEIIIGTSA